MGIIRIWGLSGGKRNGKWDQTHLIIMEPCLLILAAELALQGLDCQTQEQPGCQESGHLHTLEEETSLSA